MPRLSAHRLMVYVFSVGTFFFVVINIQVQTNGPISLGLPEGWGLTEHPDSPSLALESNTKPVKDGEGTLMTPQPTNLSPSRTLDLRSPLDPANIDIPPVEARPWYMEGGQLRPVNCPLNLTSGEREATIFPEERKGEDRLRDQLMYVPPVGFVAENLEDADIPLKKILIWNGASGWGIRPGRGVFIKEECPVSSCVIATNRREVQSADLLVFKDHFTMPGIDRPTDQLWMMFMLESPLHTQMFKHQSVFNWTATYRSDSTIVAPYERWQYYNDNVQTVPQTVNYAANKTKKVAWFVSNCKAKNGRLEYARNLSNYIDVDIYGQCGSQQCPRASKGCLSRLDTDYKFYLAFENSNCIDYITEKFFVNGLKHNVLPIVMGAPREDYERSSPYNSFIHVDDFTGPDALAAYLDKLDKDDSLYNSYFAWKGAGEMINTKFFCRLCALLHDPKERGPDNSHYSDINEWWRGKGTCINGSWRRLKEILANKKTKEEKT